VAVPAAEDFKGLYRSRLISVLLDPTKHAFPMVYARLPGRFVVVTVNTADPSNAAVHVRVTRIEVM
jgi:hypothetical protein